MTKREFYNAIIATINNDEIKAFAEKEIALLDRKNASRSSKPTKAQVENASIKANIIEIMASAEPMTVGSITSAYNGKYSTDYSSNKINALITQLKNDNKIVRTVEKKIAYFSVV